MAWQGVEGEVKKPEAYGVVTPWVKVNPVLKRQGYFAMPFYTKN
jgi:hypothetical protein